MRALFKLLIVVAASYGTAVYALTDANAECAFDYIEAALTQRGTFPDPIIGQGQRYIKGDSVFRIWDFPSRNRRIGVGINLRTNLAAAIKQENGVSTTFMDRQRASDIVRAATDRFEGCGKTTLLSIANPTMARAIRGELAYDPAYINADKLRFDVIARIRLQLYYGNRHILESEVKRLTQSYTEAEQKRDASIASIEAAKAVVDVLMLKNLDPINHAGDYAKAAQIIATTAAAANNVGPQDTSSSLDSKTLASIKGATDVAFFLTDFSKANLPLVIGGSLAIAQNHLLDSEVAGRIGESLTLLAQCAINPKEKIECISGTIEIGLKGITDYIGAGRLAWGASDRNAIIAAQNYLRIYFQAGGDSSFIYKMTDGLQYQDYESVAIFYDRKERINKKYFKEIISKYIEGINAQIEAYRPIIGE